MIGAEPLGSMPIGGFASSASQIDRRELLVAIYFEQDFVGQDPVPLRTLAGSYDFTIDVIRTALADLVGGSLIVVDGGRATGNFDLELSAVQLTSSGRLSAEQAIRDGVRATLLTSFSGGVTFSDGARFSSLVPGELDKKFSEVRDLIANEVIVVDSSLWTGLAKTRVDARNAKQIVSMIDRALNEIFGSKAGNEQMIQAASYLRAAKELAEAPSPPSEIIWQLVSKAADIVGLMGLLFYIFSPAAR